MNYSFRKTDSQSFWKNPRLRLSEVSEGSEDPAFGFDAVPELEFCISPAREEGGGARERQIVNCQIETNRPTKTAQYVISENIGEKALLG